MSGNSHLTQKQQDLLREAQRVAEELPKTKLGRNALLYSGNWSGGICDDESDGPEEYAMSVLRACKKFVELANLVLPSAQED